MAISFTSVAGDYRHPSPALPTRTIVCSQSKLAAGSVTVTAHHHMLDADDATVRADERRRARSSRAG